MKRRRAAAYVGALGAALSLMIAPPPLASGSPPSMTPANARTGLTTAGQLLWNFESLLKSRYGTAEPWTSASNRSDFVCFGQDCGPLSSEDPYFYTFSNLGKSDLKLVKVNVNKMVFGDYPVPITVNGYAVACSGPKPQFLVRFSDAASYSLTCAPPISRS
jgi:hypothetical protein